MKIFIEPAQSYLQVNETAVLLACLTMMLGSLITIYFLLLSRSTNAFTYTAFTATLTLAVVVILYSLSPPAFNYVGEQKYQQLLPLAARCGVNDFPAYRAWLAEDVLAQKAREDQELSVTFQQVRAERLENKIVIECLNS